MNRHTLFFAIFLIGLILASGCLDPDFETKKLDEHYQILYQTKIHDDGKTELDKIVNDTSYLGKSPERLNLIADLITKNFTDPNWQYLKNETFCYYPDDPLKYNYCRLKGQGNLRSLGRHDDPINMYLFDKNGRVRQMNHYNGSIALSREPYWIAFQKTGACQELSVLFNKTANESGFVTRIVQSDGISHLWNEVNIDGEWKFFDVQQYGAIKNDTTDSSKWFGNTAEYATANAWTLCDLINNGKKPGIFLFDINTGENGKNRNEAYDPNNNCTK